MDSVTTQFIDLLNDSIEEFEEGVTDLESMTCTDEEVSKATRAFIEWCRHFITGTLI